MKMIQTIRDRLTRLHRDEKGADLVEYILIIAAIALPLVALVIYFKDDLANWIGEQYEEVKDQSDDTTNPF
jgi:Flp pilus assembly pilin Flp